MKLAIKTAFLGAAFFLMSFAAGAQKADTAKSPSADDLMNSIAGPSKPEPMIGVFKSTRLVLSQTTQTVKRGNLNFQVIHRFGDAAGDNGGGKTFYGIDAVSDVYIGLEYGITDNLNVDFGRCTIGRLATLELKYALLHQTADNSVPVEITAVGEMGTHTYGNYNSYDGRLAWLGQLIVARKFSPFLTLQVSTDVLRNNTPVPAAPGNVQQFFAMQAAARIRLTKATGFIIDYAHNFSAFSQNSANGMSDPLGFGWEVQTGGHVFTLNITNARSVSEINYLSNANASYGRGQYRLGFTISRMFDLNKHKKQAG